MAGAANELADIMSDFKQTIQRKASFAQTTRAVLWGFFGVRKGAEHDRDMQLNPIHLISAGVIGATILVIVLVLVARHAVS